MTLRGHGGREGGEGGSGLGSGRPGGDNSVTDEDLRKLFERECGPVTAVHVLQRDKGRGTLCAKSSLCANTPTPYSIPPPLPPGSLVNSVRRRWVNGGGVD